MGSRIPPPASGAALVAPAGHPRRLTSIVVLCLAGAPVGGYVLVKYNSINRVDNLSPDQQPAGDPENYLDRRPWPAKGRRAGTRTRSWWRRSRVRSPGADVISRDLMVTIADTGEP